MAPSMPQDMLNRLCAQGVSYTIDDPEPRTPAVGESAGIPDYQAVAYLEAAAREADRVRREHNGVGGVYLYLGHDGDNACEFRDFDGKVLAKANSGRTRLEAVQRCEVEWRRQAWVRNLWHLMVAASRRFGDELNRVFNTANLQSEIREAHGLLVSGEAIAEALTARRDVIRLSGGCHWMLLPKGYLRHD